MTPAERNAVLEEAAFICAVEARAREIVCEEHPFADLHVEALAEIKATIDGKSDQPVAAIIEGLLEEIKARALAIRALKEQEPTT